MRADVLTDAIAGPLQTVSTPSAAETDATIPSVNASIQARIAHLRALSAPAASSTLGYISSTLGSLKHIFTSIFQPSLHQQVRDAWQPLRAYIYLGPCPAEPSCY